MSIDRLAPAIRPVGPNAGTQQWRDLLFVHWEIPAAMLAGLVPHELEIDTFQGQAYLGLVPFVMRSIKPSWWRWSTGFDFLETNVRTYVIHNGRPGVYFFSLDANSVLAVMAARIGWSLPYFPARISMIKTDDEILYQVQRRFSKAQTEIRYRIGPKLNPSLPNSIEHFLLERYLLFVHRRGQIHIGQVHHQPYSAHRIDSIDISDSLTTAACASQNLHTPPKYSHYSPGVDVEMFSLRLASSCNGGERERT